MTGRERMIRALRREAIEGHVPHFELVYYLTMEKFGKVHPEHRYYAQWNQMSEKERQLSLDDMADCFILAAETYHHDAIFLHSPVRQNLNRELAQRIRERTGDQYFIMMHNDPTFSIPDGDHMMQFAAQMYDEPEKLHEIAKVSLENSIRQAKEFQGTGLIDGFAFCSDYAFNVNPFFTPDQFAEFIFPYLRDSIAACHEMGFYVIKHTDGNINPILSQIVDAKSDALHSIDPQGHMNLANVREKYGDQVATIGNVNCGLLQTGTQEEADADVRRCLHEGMDDGKNGFIFSTSNCVYTGLPLERYERMIDIWQKEGIYGKR